MVVLARSQIPSLSHEELLDYAVNVNEDISSKIESIGSQMEEKISKIVKRILDEKLSQIDEKLSQIFDQKLADVKTVILDDVSQQLNTFKSSTKTRFEQLEAELEISKTVNATLSEQLINTQKEAHRTGQYSQYETVEFSGIPTEIDNASLEKVVRGIAGKLDVTLSAKEIQACHRGTGFRKKIVLCKLAWRGDAFSLVKNKYKLKDMDLTEVDPRLSAPIYINESLTWYYNRLRYIAKKLCDKQLIGKSWVSGHKVKV